MGGRWRRQDERSERSVRDKIAMFSSEDEDDAHRRRRRPPEGLKRAHADDEARSPGNVGQSRRQGGKASPQTPSPTSPPSIFSSMINVHSTEESKENVKPNGGGKEEGDVQSSLLLSESRSQSLIDVVGTSSTSPSRGSKRHSVGAYDRPSVYKYGVEKPEDRDRRTSLNNLIEQRRKSASKLRGLVIPDSVSGGRVQSCKKIDLPRISSIRASRNEDLKGPMVPSPGKGASEAYSFGISRRKSDSLPPPWKSPSPSSMFGGRSGSPSLASTQSFDQSEDLGLDLCRWRRRRRKRRGEDDSSEPDDDDELSSTTATTPEDEYSRHLLSRRHPRDEETSKGEETPLENGNVEAEENRRNVLKSAKCSSGRSISELATPEGVVTSAASKDLSDSDSMQQAQAVYFDREGTMYEEPQIKVAYLNEIFPEDDSEIAKCDDGRVVAEIPLRGDRWNELERKYPTPKKDEKERASRFSDAKEVEWKRASTMVDEEGKREEQNRPRGEERLLESLEILTLPDRRKFSVPEYVSAGLKPREKRRESIPSRPTSLIEGSAALDSLQQQQEERSQYLSALSPAASTDLFLPDSCCSSSASSRAGSKEVLDAFAKRGTASSAVPPPSVTPKMSEILKAFERHEMTGKGSLSLESATSDDGGVALPLFYGSASSLASGGGGGGVGSGGVGHRDQFGSITSLSSSTSIISPQELAQLIEEANHSLEESGTPSHEILVVVLHREIFTAGSSSGIGITLAGGADYETKEVTVHKVIPGSLADRDGRIQKGDRVLSINGKTLRGVPHREALNILKSPRPEVVLVLSRSRSVTPQETTATHSNGGGDAEGIGGGGFSHRPVFINHVPPPRPPKILESPMDSKSLVSELARDSMIRGPPMTILLHKDGAGLGFSLEGGKDSPLGDRPLTVKKIFSGGAADKGGILKVGDELLGVNAVDLTNMARIEAWNFLKKLPDGKVNLLIRQKMDEEETK